MAAAVEAEVRVRAAAEIRARARQLWPPGMHREELDMAAAALVKGQERNGREMVSHPRRRNSARLVRHTTSPGQCYQQ